MSKNIAVKGCTVKDMTGGGTAKIESDPNASIKCNDKNAYFGTITVSVKGSNGGGFINNKNGQGVGTITGTGTKILGGSQPAVVEGDTGSVSVTGTNTVGNVTTTVTKTVTVKITAAGQAKVVAL